MAAAKLEIKFYDASLSSLSIFLCQLIMSVHFGAYIAQNLELLLQRKRFVSSLRHFIQQLQLYAHAQT